jgi:hypothetical protein
MNCVYHLWAANASRCESIVYPNLFIRSCLGLFYAQMGSKLHGTLGGLCTEPWVGYVRNPGWVMYGTLGG